jgi:nucleotide-binding universal stress UspA family protein
MRARHNASEEENEEMAFFPRRILLATDGSSEAAAASQAAVELANSTGSELHVVHVGEFLPTLFAQTDVEPAQIEREARKTLDEQVGRIREAGGTVAESHFRLGDPDREIVRLSEELDCGLRDTLLCRTPRIFGCQDT